MDRNAMLCAVALMMAGLWPWWPARADLFEPPSVKTYLSGNARYRLTVTPGADPTPRGRKEVAPEEAAQARMERREGAGWVQVWRGPLRNPVAPPWVLVSDDGRAATFNDWYGAGHGPRVVVLYDRAGRLVRSLGLEQLLPADYVRALPRSISSIDWGREHRFSADGRRLLLRVAIPNNNERSYEPAGYVELALDAATGRRAPGYDAALKRAYAQAAPAIAREQLSWEAAKAVRRAPLLTPAGNDYGDWNHYLSEACRRLDPGEGDQSPAMLRIQLQAGRADLPELRRLIAAMSDPGDDARAMMFATTSDPRSEQDALIAALAKAAQEAPAGRLKGRRVCVLADGRRSAAAAAALARTGATYVQIDPSRPVAQRPEVLRELERN